MSVHEVGGMNQQSNVEHRFAEAKPSQKHQPAAKKKKKTGHHVAMIRCPGKI